MKHVDISTVDRIYIINMIASILNVSKSDAREIYNTHSDAEIQEILDRESMQIVEY